jgi:hypothetical protein
MEGSISGTNINTTETEEAMGLGLIDIETKFRAFLIGRMWLQSTKKGSETATWLQEWNMNGPRANPPHIGSIPTKLEYLHRYALDMAYIIPSGNDETLRTFKRPMYNTLHIMAASARETSEMREGQLSLYTNWTQVWKTLSEDANSTWYIMVHDIISTSKGLHAIRFVQSDRCRHSEK